MINPETFMLPGLWALKFILWLFGIGWIDPGLSSVFAFLLSLIFWAAVLKAVLNIIARIMGIHQQGGR
ncbi:hypothetical protein P886_4177 [Alteromonadaceae bacterium 2753L.S.0a.02]|nr:hypothetical protein P886_4177 [Alteromonadaceae bacterium 2753L.S.0a.02]